MATSKQLRAWAIECGLKDQLIKAEAMDLSLKDLIVIGLSNIPDPLPYIPGSIPVWTDFKQVRLAPFESTVRNCIREYVVNLVILPNQWRLIRFSTIQVKIHRRMMDKEITHAFFKIWGKDEPETSAESIE